MQLALSKPLKYSSNTHTEYLLCTGGHTNAWPVGHARARVITDHTHIVWLATPSTRGRCGQPDYMMQPLEATLLQLNLVAENHRRNTL